MLCGLLRCQDVSWCGVDCWDVGVMWFVDMLGCWLVWCSLLV